MTPAQERLQKAKFDMFTEEGNQCIREHLAPLIDYIDTGLDVRPPIIEKMFLSVLKKVGEVHREVYDTEPPVCIKWHIAKCLQDNYYNSSLFTFSYY